MAENEILDVGSPRRYVKFRKALRNTTFSPDQIADCLPDEFVALTRKSLRGTPLYLILQACDKDRVALQAVIAQCKNRDLAVLAEQAYRCCKSEDSNVVAEKLTTMLLDQLVDRVRYQVFKSEDLDDDRRQAILEATSERLKGCKTEIVTLLSASLCNVKLPRILRASNKRTTQSARALSETSLLQATQSSFGAPVRA